MPAQQHSRRLNTVLLRNLHHPLIPHEGAPSRPQRRVRHDVDTLLLAQIHNLLLRQQRVVLNLVHRRHDLRLRQQLLQIPLGVVTHPDRLGLARLDQLLQLLPRINMVILLDDIPRPIRQHGELVVVALGVHEQGPVQQVQVDVVEPQRLEALVEALLHARVVRRPHLGHDEDVLALDARVEGGLQPLADLILITVTVRAVDELVACLERYFDARGDFALAGLPGACGKDGQLAWGVAAWRREDVRLS